jgi:hypothetical protein
MGRKAGRLGCPDDGIFDWEAGRKKIKGPWAMGKDGIH